MAAVAAVVATGGWYREPYLMSRVSRGRQTLWRVTPRSSRAWRPTDVAVIAEGMRQAVRSGTARGLYGVAGDWAAKTGTAQWQSHLAGWVVAYNQQPLVGRHVAVAVMLPPQVPASGATTAAPAGVAANDRTGHDAINVLASLARSLGTS
jgi:membrane peptidoglycan carboxypeptidase